MSGLGYFRRWVLAVGAIGASLTTLVWSQGAGTATSPTKKFFDDDPLAREPETRDASAVQAYDIVLTASLVANLFLKPGDQRADVKAGNINTIDEVPDSSWFTNRVYARPISVEEIIRGPNTIDGPAPGRWTIVGAKTSGAAPGFRVKDERGETWFISLDAKGSPRAATAAIAVAARLFWALGYYQIESYLASFHPRDLLIADSATISPRPGRTRRMKMSDIQTVLDRAAEEADGSYRVLAARALSGRVLGGFPYFGTRPDDPNDIVPHEHRRELRALKVFAAWTNLVDLKALNTLDTVVPADGKQVVRHYLQDVGSTFGTGALAPHDWDEGHELLFEADPAWRRLVSFGFYLRPWQTMPFYEHPEIGRIGKVFDPAAWKPRSSVAPLRTARDDDTFWAALRVAAFSDDLLAAAVNEGQFADPAAAAMLTKALGERRDAIARTYLTRITPLTRFALGADGTLTFDDAAVRYAGAAPPSHGYSADWFLYDNAADTARPLGASPVAREGRLTAPAGVSTVPREAFVKITLRAIDRDRPEWRPIDVYFRGSGSGWRLVGVDR